MNIIYGKLPDGVGDVLARYHVWPTHGTWAHFTSFTWERSAAAYARQCAKYSDGVVTKRDNWIGDGEAAAILESQIVRPFCIYVTEGRL